MNEEVLREFLVKLGFKVDEVGMKKFVTAVETVSKGVQLAGVAVAATATGIVAGVAVISSQMEKLYYASQRTNEAAGNIMGLRYAAAQIGLTADQAQSSLEGFARTLRLSPGTNNLLSSLGVTGDGPAAKFDSFIAKMKEQKPYVAAAYAGLFGIDPDTLLMLEQGQDKRLDLERQYQKKLADFHINPAQAAESGKDFNNSIRNLTNDFELLWVVIESKLNPVIVPLIDQFERWEEGHADQVASAIASAVQELAHWISTIDWEKTGKEVDGFFDDIVAATKAVSDLIGQLTTLSNLKITIGSSSNDWSEIKNILSFIVNAGKAITAALNGDYKGADGFAEQALNGLNSLIDTEVGVHRVNGAPVNNDAGDFSDFGKILEEPSGDGDFSDFGKISEEPATGRSSAGSSRTPRGIRNNNPGNITAGSFANQHGATGSDGDFATFASMQDGIRAAIALLQSYAARGIDTVRTIISRWAPGSENDTAAYIADVAKKLGVSADQHLSGDQLGGVAQAIFGHENGAQYGKIGVGAPVGGTSVNVTQKTDIHVSGTSDPHGTARSVASEQRRVNGDLVRNFVGAVA